LLDQIEHAGTSELRDDLYLRLALLALSSDSVREAENERSDFDIKGILHVIANNDFDRAIQARGFREESPRANATIAICESVLNGKE